jgi:hypothetical protein
MVALAWIIDIVASICTIMGIIIAAEILPVFLPALTGMFWLVLAGVLFLAAIASAIASRPHD